MTQVIKILAIFLLCVLSTACSPTLESCQEFYNQGLDEGHDEGYREGHDDGYDEGHDDGYDEGHSEVEDICSGYASCEDYY